MTPRPTADQLAAIAARGLAYENVMGLDSLPDEEISIGIMAVFTADNNEQCASDRNALLAEVHALQARLAQAEELLRKSKRQHVYCQDCWYSCPKSEDGCCDDGQGDECNCGADTWNAKVDEYFADSPQPEQTECVEQSPCDDPDALLLEVSEWMHDTQMMGGIRNRIDAYLKCVEDSIEPAQSAGGET